MLFGFTDAKSDVTSSHSEREIRNVVQGEIISDNLNFENLNIELEYFYDAFRPFWGFTASGHCTEENGEHSAFPRKVVHLWMTK